MYFFHSAVNLGLVHNTIHKADQQFIFVWNVECMQAQKVEPINLFCGSFELWSGVKLGHPNIP